jgi:hypothetical protein
MNKESKILSDKLDKFPSKKAIISFYWDRDMIGKSIKAKAYKKDEFEKTRDYLKLILRILNLALDSDRYLVQMWI